MALLNRAGRALRPFHGWAHRGLALLALGLAVADPTIVTAAEEEPAAVVEGEIFYTRYKGGGDNVKKVPFRYDRGSLTLGAPIPLAETDGANGIERAPDGTLLVGSGGDRVHRVVPDGSGTHETVSAGGALAHHMTLDPDGTRVWAGGAPSAPAEIPLAPFADGVLRPLGGDDPSITQIVFDETGRAFYTSGDYTGWGHFGRVDLARFVTRRLLADVEAAHGLTHDAYTGDLILFGGNEIAQIDPDRPGRIKSRLRVNLGSQFDVGRTDGRGHLFATRNDGQLLFVDYARSGLIGDSGNQTHVVYLDSYIDDLVLHVVDVTEDADEPPIAAAPAATTTPAGGDDGAAAADPASPAPAGDAGPPEAGAAPADAAPLAPPDTPSSAPAPAPAGAEAAAAPPSAQDVAAAGLSAVAAAVLGIALALAMRRASAAPLSAGLMALANGGLGGGAAYAAIEGLTGGAGPDLATAALVLAAALALLRLSARIGNGQIAGLGAPASLAPAFAGGPSGGDDFDLARAETPTGSGPTRGGRIAPPGDAADGPDPTTEAAEGTDAAPAPPEDSAGGGWPAMLLPLIAGKRKRKRPAGRRRAVSSRAAHGGVSSNAEDAGGGELDRRARRARERERAKADAPPPPMAYLSLTAEEVVAHLRAREPERGVRIEIEPEIVAPAPLDALRPVLRALITHAWQRTAGVANPRIALATATTRGETSYVVRDNGAPPERLPDGGWAWPTTDEARGGRERLDAARRIVEGLGGRLWVEAAPDGGTDVQFSLGGDTGR